jgi:alpha-D-ribose 1-methylphosphonate 5-triphosphate diphosphatase
MISEAPARIMGLADRGRRADGMRADVVAVSQTTRRVEKTLSAVRVAHLSGEFARRAAGA